MPSSSIRGRINRKSLVVKTQDPTNVIDNELVSVEDGILQAANNIYQFSFHL